MTEEERRGKTVTESVTEVGTDKSTELGTDRALEGWLDKLSLPRM